MKFGQGLRKGMYERLMLALGQDPSIITPRQTLQDAPGSTIEYLTSLGLRKADLKRLEACGFAMRGYSRPTGGNQGLRVRWLIIADDSDAA